jgi:hypothetical protein
MTVLIGKFRAQLTPAAETGDDGGALTDADFRGCRWIEGDARPVRHGMFCGLPVAPGESWCDRHRHIVFGQALSLAG